MKLFIYKLIIKILITIMIIVIINTGTHRLQERTGIWCNGKHI